MINHDNQIDDYLLEFKGYINKIQKFFRNPNMVENLQFGEHLGISYSVLIEDLETTAEKITISHRDDDLSARTAETIYKLQPELLALIKLLKSGKPPQEITPEITKLSAILKNLPNKKAAVTR